PLTKAALLQLSSVWPKSLHFTELLQAARSNLSPSLAQRNGDIALDDALRLGDFLLRAYAASLVELHSHPSQFVLEVSARPTASRLARLQLQTADTVTTMRHTSAQVLDSVGRQLLMLLDGTRDREALLKDLSSLLKSGQVVMHREGRAVNDRDEALQIVK